MESLALINSLQAYSVLYKIGYRVSDLVDSQSEENSAWFLVALVVLAAFGLALIPAMFMFCVSRGMQFSGSWQWAHGHWTPAIWLECK
jgi:hypothetical protein